MNLVYEVTSLGEPVASFFWGFDAVEYAKNLSELNGQYPVEIKSLHPIGIKNYLGTYIRGKKVK